MGYFTSPLTFNMTYYIVMPSTSYRLLESPGTDKLTPKGREDVCLVPRPGHPGQAGGCLAESLGAATFWEELRSPAGGRCRVYKYVEMKQLPTSIEVKDTFCDHLLHGEVSGVQACPLTSALLPKQLQLPEAHLPPIFPGLSHEALQKHLPQDRAHAGWGLPPSTLQREGKPGEHPHQNDKINQRLRDQRKDHNCAKFKM